MWCCLVGWLLVVFGIVVVVFVVVVFVVVVVAVVVVDKTASNDNNVLEPRSSHQQNMTPK